MLNDNFNKGFYNKSVNTWLSEDVVHLIFLREKNRNIY